MSQGDPQGTEPKPSASEERRPSAATRLDDVEELELSIDRLVGGGDGLGRFEGIPIFVPRSAPGDRLRVRLVERRPDYGRGEIVEILEPGPGRRKPPCPYFAECGGCDLQHLEDALQTRLKAEALRETLGRLGQLRDLPKIRVRAGQPWGYRLRTQLHTEVGEDGVRVGYHARGSNDLVAVDRCPVLVPELEGQLLTLTAHLPAKPPKRLDLAAGDGGAVTTAPVVEGLPHGPVETRVGDLVYSYDARCFFQGHRGLLPALVEETVGTFKGELAYDLYSGAGLFSLPLARNYSRVVAVEADTVAVRYAKNNARRNRITNVEAVSKSVERWIGKLESGADRLVLDPPRTGLSVEVRRALVAKRPRRVTYVSCHGAALARDLRALREHYRIDSLAVLDLFPQTAHLEIVAQLELI